MMIVAVPETMNRYREVSMMITNRLEKNTILCALKVQLKRLNEDRDTYKSMPVSFIVSLNEEVARIKSLISSMEEEL